MWWIIKRTGVLLMTLLVGKQLYDAFSKKISPDKVYSVEEVSKLLRVEKTDIIELILTGRLKATKIKDEYRILGGNLIVALSEIRRRKHEI